MTNISVDLAQYRHPQMGATTPSVVTATPLIHNVSPINMKKSINPLLILLGLLPSAAFAHVGHDAGIHHLGFIQGVVHPFSGVDHLCAMLLVGIWSAMNTRRWWVAPLSFASVLLLGALVGMSGLVVPATEYLVASSLLVVGVMVALQMKLQPLHGALIVAAMAFFHGVAHGSELTHAFSALSGMVIATALIHVGGLAIGYGLLNARWKQPAARVIGLLSSLIGVALLGGVF